MGRKEAAMAMAVQDLPRLADEFSRIYDTLEFETIHPVHSSF